MGRVSIPAADGAQAVALRRLRDDADGEAAVAALPGVWEKQLEVKRESRETTRMKYAIALFLAASSLYGETICGRKYSTPDFHVIYVECLKSPDGAPLTRVVGRPKFGQAAFFSLPDQQWLVGTYKDEKGVTWMGVYFHGDDHQELPKIVVLVAVAGAS